MTINKTEGHLFVSADENKALVVDGDICNCIYLPPTYDITSIEEIDYTEPTEMDAEDMLNQLNTIVNG